MSLILTAAVSICLNQTLAVVSMQTVETQITSSSNINKLVNQERQLTTNTPNHDHKHHHHHHHHDAQHRSDAPKFYHLNELLYKTTDGNESPQAAALPNFARPLASDGAAKMSQLKPRGMTRNLAPTNGHNADSGESSIEGLVRMMQARGKPQDGANAIDDDDSDVGGADAGSDRSPPMTRRLANGARGSSVGDRGESAHEATIQRKTNLDDDASGLPEADRSPSSLTASSTSSRFRTRGKCILIWIDPQ